MISILDVLHTVLRSSPSPREQAVTVLLERGVEQLYCLLLKTNYGDEARERVFRVRISLYFKCWYFSKACIEMTF